MQNLPTITIHKGECLRNMTFYVYDETNKNLVTNVTNYNLYIIITDLKSKVLKKKITATKSSDNTLFKVTLSSDDTFSIGVGNYLYKVITVYTDNNYDVHVGNLNIIDGVEESWIQ